MGKEETDILGIVLWMLGAVQIAVGCALFVASLFPQHIVVDFKPSMELSLIIFNSGVILLSLFFIKEKIIEKIG